MGRWMRERGITYLVGALMGLGLYCLGRMSAETKIHDPRDPGVAKAGLWLEPVRTDHLRGVRVLTVDHGSHSDRIGLRPGDVLYCVAYELKAEPGSFYQRGVDSERSLADFIADVASRRTTLTRVFYRIIREDRDVQVQFSPSTYPSGSPR